MKDRTDARAHCFITGRVQGVFFRANTRREAQARGVHGWVRNLPDGRVEAVFEGSRPAVEEVIAWCHKGPPYGHVEHVVAEWEEPMGERHFEVRY